jgi:hypothetical protein
MNSYRIGHIELLCMPVTADHLKIAPDYTCAACHQPLKLGELHTLFPLGPGNNPEARAKARAGQHYESIAAVPVHWACVTGDE